MPGLLFRKKDLARARALARALDAHEELLVLSRTEFQHGATRAALREAAGHLDDAVVTLVSIAASGQPMPVSRARDALERARRSFGWRRARPWSLAADLLPLPSERKRIPHPGAYVAICRRVARGQRVARGDAGVDKLYAITAWGDGREDRYDARLVAAGWRWQPPAAWIARGGGLDTFLSFWAQATARPGVVGSCFNAPVSAVVAAYRAGIPAWIVRRLGAAGLGKLLEPRGGYRGGRVTGRRLERLRAIARAVWTHGVRGGAWRFRADALRALGRLSPELRRFAVEIVQQRDLRDVRARDLPWLEIAQRRDRFRGARGEAARIAAAVGRRRDALLAGRGLSAVLAPEYPVLPAAHAVDLALGVTPREIARKHGVALTAREAVAWLRAGGPLAVLRWLLTVNSLPQSTPSERVARWLLAVRERGDWDALTVWRAHRRAPPADGGPMVEVQYKLLDRIDEVRDEDLVAGARTGVRVAFERAIARSLEIEIEKSLRDQRILCEPPSDWQPVLARMARRVRALITRAALATEGRELGHCVGSCGLDRRTRDGRVLVLAINARGQRATVTLVLDAGGGADDVIEQVKGPRNVTPIGPLAERTLRTFLRRVGAAQAASSSRCRGY